MISSRALIVAGIAIAIVIGIGAVFFASSDPDGLDRYGPRHPGSEGADRAR